MRVLLRIGLCFLVAGGMMAQRRGGGGTVGVSRGGGGFRGGSISGGFRGNTSGRFRGFTGFRGVGRFGWGTSYYYPYGWGSWDYPYDDYSPYIPGYPVYDYNTSPNVTVIYPAAPQANTVYYTAPAQPVLHTYDQYGQEVRTGASNSGAPDASPIYLIAMKDQVIRAAAAYWVDGDTLHYVTLQHEEKQAPLSSVDRPFTLQLNRERRVSISLPQ